MRRRGQKDYQGASGKSRIEGKFTERKGGGIKVRAAQRQPGGEFIVSNHKV